MDSYLEAEQLVKKVGAKKALQLMNDKLWSEPLTNLQKAHTRAIIYYTGNIGMRKNMIAISKRKNKKK